MAVFHHLDQDLGRNIVGKVADQSERGAFHHLIELQPQKVCVDQLPVEAGELVLKKIHHIFIGFNGLQFVAAFEQEARQHAFSRADFQDAAVTACPFQALHNALGDVLAGQKMLSV